jgi:hypothetical protein
MFVKLAVGLGAFVAAMLSAGLIVLIQGGIATVYVQDDDMWLYVPVPMVAADIALAFAPEEELQKVRMELEPYSDLVIAALDELADCPDVTFVEVESRDEHVVVRKEGGTLIIKVDEGENTKVRVKVPFRSVNRLVSRLVS